MKFFTIFSQKEVHPAPGEKIIPSSEYSTLQSADDILKTVRQEEIEQRRAALAEAEQIKKEARQKGFQEGLESLNTHILTLDQELKAIREEVHKQILPLALKAARKIIGEELKLHPDRIVDIVITALKPVTQHRRIVIYVNRADLEAVEKGKSKIKSIFENLDSFSLQERSDVEPGGCMIETEAGIINAQLENQWRALEAAFDAFMKNR